MEDIAHVGSIFIVSNVAVSALYLGHWLLKGDKDYWRCRGIPHEPRRYLFQIYRDQLFKDDHVLEMERVRKYGKIYGVFEHKPNLIVCDPSLLSMILNNNKTFGYRRVYDYSQPVFEFFVPTLNGPRWNRVRKTMSHAFTVSNLKMMIPSVYECAESLIDRFWTCYENGSPADCKRFFGDFAMDVLARCAFSIHTDAQQNPDDPFVFHARNAFGRYAALKTLSFFILTPYLRHLLGVHFLNKESVDFFKDTIMRELRVRETSEKKNDFLDVMMAFYEIGLEVQREEEIKKLNKIRSQLEKGLSHQLQKEPPNQDEEEIVKFLTYDELVAQSVMFFVVGYETIVSLMCFLAYNLACHPEVQERLIFEVDRKMGEKGGELDYDDVKSMEYMKMVVDETLRIQPPTIKAERTATNDYKVPNRHFSIEKGTTVGYSIYAIHHDPDFYPEPFQFDPERFRNWTPPTASFVPFGRGRRNCMGEHLAMMEAKHCLVKVLSTSRFKTCDATTIPMRYQKNQGLLSPRDCILRVVPRCDAPDVHLRDLPPLEPKDDLPPLEPKDDVLKCPIHTAAI